MHASARAVPLGHLSGTALHRSSLPQCHECGRHFPRRRSDQAYCSAGCNAKAGNRAQLRSRVLYRALYHWRLSRRGAQNGADLGFICREIQAWIEEDRAAGRIAPPLHDHLTDRGHLRRTPRGPTTRAGRADQ
jgi:hypothetical protein